MNGALIGAAKPAIWRIRFLSSYCLAKIDYLFDKAEIFLPYNHIKQHLSMVYHQHHHHNNYHHHSFIAVMLSCTAVLFVEENNAHITMMNNCTVQIL